MSSENVSPSIAKFAADVRRALAHLSADQIAELTGDLEANITASVADGAPIPNVDSYVNELLSAAGLEIPRTKSASKYADMIAIVRIATRGLAPMWWFIRAIAVTIIAGSFTSTMPAFGAGYSGIRVADRGDLGLVVFVGSVLASIWIGRRERRWPSLLSVVPAVIVVVLAMLQVGDEMRYAALVESGSSSQCAGLGFDSYGRRGFPASAFPDILGLSLFDADRKISDWGKGLATMSLEAGGEFAMSPRASIVDVSEPYIYVAGGCPNISVNVTVAESPVTTALPEVGSTSTIIPNSAVPSQTTFPASPSVVTFPSSEVETTTSSLEVPTTTGLAG
jgi:hypothetical protein